MRQKPIIEFINYSFQYYSQAEPTLHDINLKINPGEKILIVGPSGSGKSTLGYCINGLIPFSYKGKIKGSLKVQDLITEDQNIFILSKIIGTVLQDSDGQFVGLTVGEDIAFAMENDNVKIDEMNERVRKVSAKVDMEKLLNSSPFELSGGQKQKTSLAGVMVDDVDILLFDEPLANLDPATGKATIEIIDDIHKQTGKTIIIIEHRLEDVLYCDIDRVIVMEEGRIVADMCPDELVSSSILVQDGIREPLYVTALKYAGISVSKDMKPGYLSSLDVNTISQPLKEWYQSIKKPEEESEEKQSILRMDNVSFSYDGKHQILDNVSFKVDKGEMIAIVGKNGAGKSTIAKVLCGFEIQDSGDIYYQGQNVIDKSIKERAEIIGLVMQNPNQMISKTLVFDEVALGLRLRNVDEEEIRERVKKILEICGLAPFIEWPISALSFGQKKRVTIASILILDPKIIILDEPTAGQDYRHYTEIMKFLEEINKLGVTIIMITHDMHLMQEYTPRAVVLAEGKVIADTHASVVLTDHEIIKRANLKETSLYNLAQRVGISDKTDFVQSFINFEKGVRVSSED